MIITSVRQASASEMASEIDRRGAAIEKLEAERDGLLDALTAAEARIAGLEAALEPLARRIDEIEQVKAIAKFSVEGTAAVKLADLRRAREALSRQEGGR